MPGRLRLENFDTTTATADAPASGGAAPGPTPELIEHARLEGYESGYKAGWDDATRAEAEAQGRIGAEFARNLQDLGFTFHEARSHVMHALEPLLTTMVERVLPDLVARTIGQTIIEELLPLASEAADVPIEVVVCPASRPALEPMLAGAKLPFTLVEEPTLAEGQVYLRSDQAERHIDFTDAVDRIGAAISGLYDLNEKAFQNG
jgi:flagellar biosynthesis/type III secretory pathway protein FliH